MRFGLVTHFIQSPRWLDWLPGLIRPGLARLLKPGKLSSLVLADVPGEVWRFPLPAGWQLPRWLYQAKAAQTGQVLQKKGCQVVGLDQQLAPLSSFFSRQGLRVTTGWTLAAAGGLDLLLRFSASEMQNARVVVLNPTSPPGPAIARYLSRRLRYVALMGNYMPGMERLARHIMLESGTAVVVTGFDREILAAANLVVDFWGIDYRQIPLARDTVVWSPGSVPLWDGAVAFSHPLWRLPVSQPICANLPAGIVTSEFAEPALVCLAPGGWPRSLSEITLDNIATAADLARITGIRPAGYMSGSGAKLI